MKKYFDKRTLFFLLLITVFGLWLRFYQLDEGIIFGYDQARDAYRARAILREGDLKLLGPETDIPGVHHGVGYYYLLAIPYALSDDPVFAASFLVLLNSAGIFIVYIAARLLFQKKRIALISSLLFAVSFEIIQYARWLSNPSLGILTVLVAFVGLWQWIRGQQKGFILAMIAIAASLHFQFFLVYLYLVPLMVFYIHRPKVSLSTLFVGILAALLVDSSILLAEIKFNFQAVKALLLYFSAQTSGYVPVSDFLIRFVDRITSVVFHSVIPFNPVLAFLLVVLIFTTMIKLHERKGKYEVEKFLLLWLFSSFPIFIFSSGALNSEFSFVGVVLSIIFLSAMAFNSLWERESIRLVPIIILLILIAVNIRFTLVHAKDGAYIFSVQRVLTYGLEKQIIDYTYQEAQGQPFSICTLTNPLFINTTWAYLYETYGKNRYDYLPYWAGIDQRDYLGDLPPEKELNRPKLRFLIFEPPVGMPEESPSVFTSLENYVSDVIDTRKFGDFRVDKRVLLSVEERIKRRESYSPKYSKRFDNPDYIPYRCFH